MGIKDHDSMTLYYAVGVYGWVLDCFPLTFWKKKKEFLGDVQEKWYITY